MYIDTHCHLTFPQYDNDVESIISRAQQAGVSHLINVGTDLENIEKSFEQLHKYNFVYYSLGIHPHDAHKFSKETLAALKEFSKNKNVAAIGETGLDYHYPEPSRESQKFAFQQQIELAKELNLPLIIHSREAYFDILTILPSRQAGIKMYKNLKGVFHCFSGNIEEARQVLDLGFYISFTANITYPKTDRLKEVVSFVPLDKILIETDSPYLAPQAFRGKRNEPAYVVYVAQEIAKIKNIMVDEVAKVTTTNAMNLFNLL